jgi:hypothetical protein
MNLLELQVLAVVSRIPDGSDAPSPDFDYEPPAGDVPAPAAESNADPRPVPRS